MPFSVLTLQQARANARDYISAKLPGSELAPPNSRLRVLSDSNAAGAQLNLMFLQWLSLQFLPDTAETEWLDRHANIWLGGRKTAAFASGNFNFTGTAGRLVPAGTQLYFSDTDVVFQTTADVTLGSAGPTAGAAIALTAGMAGNIANGTTVAITSALTGVDGTATAAADFSGGIDTETDDELRLRVLDRIRQPPMGGDANDYAAWALAVPGVTRAWCSPLEMGIGTVTVRFMMDDVRSSTGGFPLAADVAAVQAYLDTVRPVAVKDFFVVAPMPEPVNFTVSNLSPNTTSMQAAIVASVTAMLAQNAAPGYSLNGVAQPAQTIYAVWVSEAIRHAGANYFDLTMADHVMPNAGAMAVLGSITWI
jgi:uncharacterized phage protein gp47/JayE